MLELGHLGLGSWSSIMSCGLDRFWSKFKGSSGRYSYSDDGRLAEANAKLVPSWLRCRLGNGERQCQGASWVFDLGQASGA